MVKFCDKCGAELKSENVKFCDKCGAKVANNSNNINTNVSGITCPKCGNIVPVGQEACSNCGQVIESNKTTVIIGYIVAILFSFIGLIPGIYLLTRKIPKSQTQGIIICLISILSFLGNWIFYLFWIFIVALIIIGIYLWTNDTKIIQL